MNRFSITGLLPSMAALSRDILLTNIHFLKLPRDFTPDTILLQPPTTPRYARVEFLISNFKFLINYLMI